MDTNDLRRKIYRNLKEAMDLIGVNSMVNSIDMDLPLQLIYYGAPGTGKSYTIDEKTNEGNSVRTTFHPDSDYASFVGAYKPTMKHQYIHYVNSDGIVRYTNPDKNKEGRLHSGKEQKIVYKYVPQAFLKAYVEAWKRYDENEDHPYYLIIEEINRGNCAQIFGDLFQLLDRNNEGSSSYAITADEDISQFLKSDENGFAERSEENPNGLTNEQRARISSFILKKDSGAVEEIGESILNGTKLLLPPNLRIWATMNTSDQSLFPIDSAFKRRWNWEYIPIDTNPKDKTTNEPLNWKLEAGGKLYTWGSFLDVINPLIDGITQSEDKQMGYFFAKPDKKSKEDLEKNDIISEKVFVNKVLFYLWTDVLKDYDLTQDKFTYTAKDADGKEVKRAFKFTNFFPIENNKLLKSFVEGLHLTEIVEEENLTFDSDGDAELNDSTSGNTQRDYSKYSVNGIGAYTKSDAVVEAIRALVKSMSDPTSKNVIDKVKSFNLSYTLVYSEADFNYYLERSNDPRFAKRYAKLQLPNGEVVYVYRGSTPERIAELIKGLNETDSSVVLKKIQ